MEMTDLAIQQLIAINEVADLVTEINADSSGISKNAFTNIAKLTNLRELRLSNTRIDNDACQLIAQASSLESLSLTQTMVTDAGVAALTSLQNL